MTRLKKSNAHFLIYYVASGFGLKKDALIFERFLTELGYSCEVFELPKRLERYTFWVRILLACAKKLKLLSGFQFLFRSQQETSVVHIHLETIVYEKLYARGVHVLVPNQEWFDLRTLDLLPYMTSVWCKTKLAQHIFKEFSCNTQLISFCSGFAASPVCSTPSRDYFFSRTGISQYRGADSLIALWSKHPEWPPLKIVIDPSRRPAYRPANVEYIDVFKSHEEYVAVAAGALFHLYMTQTEGFGHSIVEALGYGAVVIVTDAPPMNEIVSADCAVLVPSKYLGQQRLSPRFAADEQAIEAAVLSVLSMPDERIAALSIEAKKCYEVLQIEFKKNLQIAIEALSR